MSVKTDKKAEKELSSRPWRQLDIECGESKEPGASGLDQIIHSSVHIQADIAPVLPIGTIL